jgi:hypothetical protein
MYSNLNLATNIFTADDWVKVSQGGTIPDPCAPLYNAAMSVVFDSSLVEDQITPKGEKIPIPSSETFFGDLGKTSQKHSVVDKGAQKKADQIADAIDAAVDAAGSTPDDSPKPTDSTKGETISLVGTVKDSLLGEPDVDTLNGEINLTWNKGTKQIILICFSGREPLVHYHQRIKGKPSKHGIEKATTKSLTHWLEWLHV